MSQLKGGMGETFTLNVAHLYTDTRCVKLFRPFRVWFNPTPLYLVPCSGLYASVYGGIAFQWSRNTNTIPTGPNFSTATNFPNTLLPIWCVSTLQPPMTSPKPLPALRHYPLRHPRLLCQLWRSWRARFDLRSTLASAPAFHLWSCWTTLTSTARLVPHLHDKVFVHRCMFYICLVCSNDKHVIFCLHRQFYANISQFNLIF